MAASGGSGRIGVVVSGSVAKGGTGRGAGMGLLLPTLRKVYGVLLLLFRGYCCCCAADLAEGFAEIVAEKLTHMWIH